MQKSLFYCKFYHSQIEALENCFIESFSLVRGQKLHYARTQCICISNDKPIWPKRIYNSHYGNGVPAIWCWQCLPLSSVQLKCQHCRKHHSHNGVVDTSRLTELPGFKFQTLLMKCTKQWGHSIWLYNNTELPKAIIVVNEGSFMIQCQVDTNQLCFKSE